MNAPHFSFIRGAHSYLRAALLLTTLAAARAQQAPPRAKPEADEKSETVVLSPFTVESTEGSGYHVHDTLAGTRLRSDINDVGAAITEVSKTVISDLAISNVMDLVGFLPSTTPESTQVALGDGSGSFRSIRFNVRGIFTEQIGRNFFSSGVGEYMPPLDPFNSDRLTLAAGANSILFGSVTPAGLVNFSTEQANLFKNSSRFSYRWDSYQSGRAEVATNQIALKDKLAVRVDLLDEHKKGFRSPQYYDQKRAYLAVIWKPFASTTVTANLEGGVANNNTPFPTPFTDRISKWAAFGSPTVAYNAAVNPATLATGLANAAAANVTQVLLGSGLTAAQQVQNWKNYAISSGTLAGLTQTNTVELPFFANPKLNIGNSRINDRRILIGDVEVEQRITKDLYAQISYFYNHHQKYVGNTGNNIAFADASTTLPDGTPNPNAGMYYTGGGTVNLQDFLYTNATYRATVTYHLDLTRISPWLGHTEFAGLLERDDSLRLTDVTRLQNVTPLAGFNTSIVNAQNSIQPVFYFNPRTGDRASAQDLNLLNYPTLFSRLPGVTARYLALGPGTDSLARQGVAQIAAQSFWLKNHLVTTVGFRNDTQNTWDVLNAKWPTNPDGTYVSWHQGYPLQRTLDPLVSNVSEPTHSYGAVAHLIRGWGPVEALSLTFNTSTNFQVASALPTFGGLPIGGATGKTKDYGVNLSLLQGKLNFKVSRFESGQQNVRLSNTEFIFIITDYNAIYTALAAQDPSYTKNIFTNTNLTDTFNVDSKGYEFSGSYEPNNNFRLALFGSENTAVRSAVGPNTFAYVAANRPVVTQFPNVQVTGSTIGTAAVSSIIASDDAQLAVLQSTNGRAQPEQSKWKFSLLANYQFTTGPLRGFNVGGYVNWLDRPILGYAWQNAAATIADFSRPFYGAYTMDTGMFVGYTRNLTRRIVWKIQANIRNLLDDTSLKPIRADEQFGHTGVQQNYAWRYVEPRSLIVTNTFSF